MPGAASFLVRANRDGREGQENGPGVAPRGRCCESGNTPAPLVIDAAESRGGALPSSVAAKPGGKDGGCGEGGRSPPSPADRTSAERGAWMPPAPPSAGGVRPKGAAVGRRWRGPKARRAGEGRGGPAAAGGRSPGKAARPPVPPGCDRTSHVSGSPLPFPPAYVRGG